MEQTGYEWVASPLQGEGESESSFKGSDTPHLNPLPSGKGRGDKDQRNELQLLKAGNQRTLLSLKILDGPNPFDALSFGDDNARPC